MKPNIFVTFALITAVVLCVQAVTQQHENKNPTKDDDREPVVVFVCEHGSAKSTVAAAYFNKLATQRGLNAHAISRGINPDQDVAPKVAAGLAADGLAGSAAKPQKLSGTDVAKAIRVITFCDLPKDLNNTAPVERWDDIPPVTEDYGKSRDAMIERIKQLLDKLKPAK